MFNLLIKMFDSAKVTPEGRDTAMELVTKNITYKTGLGWTGKFLDTDGEMLIPSQQLRSSADFPVFRISSFYTKLCCQRSFSYQAPTVWDELPVSVHHASSVGSLFQIFFENLSLFKNLSFSPIALRFMCFGVCLCVCVCV